MGLHVREGSSSRAEVRLTPGFMRMCIAQPDCDRALTMSLARIGHYDVRLLQLVPETAAEPTPICLELYSHETQCRIDSCRCYDLEAAVKATEEFIARARQLAWESHGTGCDG
jgi:hypothetical protein